MISDNASLKSPLLKVNNLWVRYGSNTVLEDVNLTIDGPGEILGIIGPNGSGKTTLLKAILGLVAISKGEIAIGGQPPQKARHCIGYVPQYFQYDYDFPISVEDVVLTGRLKKAGLLRRYSKEDKAAVHDALEKVGMLEYKKSQIGALSGGQRQRVFIARALCNHPKFLLMDEPNTGLDSFMQDELYRLLDALKKDMAIIVISHDIGAVSAHMDKIACMNRRLFFHDNKEMSQSDFISSYGCSIDLVAHGVPHRVLETHAYAHGAPGSTCGCPTHTHAHTHTHTHTPSSPTPISLSNVTESKTETKTEEKAKAKAKDANKTEEK